MRLFLEWYASKLLHGLLCKLLQIRGIRKRISSWDKDWNIKNLFHLIWIWLISIASRDWFGSLDFIKIVFCNIQVEILSICQLCLGWRSLWFSLTLTCFPEQTFSIYILLWNHLSPHFAGFANPNVLLVEVIHLRFLFFKPLQAVCRIWLKFGTWFYFYLLVASKVCF
jgi:hypothetical protein